MTIRRHTGIITGAGSGLGQAIALELAREKWDLIITDINIESCEETLMKVKQAGGLGEVYQLDVRDTDAWKKLLKRAQDKWNHCDLLVNNAGVSGAGLIGGMPLEDWRWLFDINFFGYLNGCHFFLDWLKTNPNGASIVNTCSASAFYSCPTMGAYSAAKSAVMSLSETLYAELRDTKVSTTVVFPYFFKTNLLNSGRFQHDSQKGLAHEESEMAGISAEEIARITISAMKRKKLYVFVPFWKSRLIWFLKRMFPVLTLNILATESQRRLRMVAESKA